MHAFRNGYVVKMLHKQKNKKKTNKHVYLTTLLCDSAFCFTKMCALAFGIFNLNSMRIEIFHTKNRDCFFLQNCLEIFVKRFLYA